MNIIQAISDKKIFRPFLQNKKGSLKSWRNWGVALRLLYGIRVHPKYSKLVQLCTGRRLESFNPDGVGFNTALFLIGRRGGKSKISSVVSAYESVLGGKDEALSIGETGMCACISASKKQGRVSKNYIRAIFDTTPLLNDEILPGGSRESFELTNGIVVEVMVGDYRNVRDYTLTSCVISELAFFGLTEESKVKTDTELVRAIIPGLASVHGRLIGISTKYSRKGYCYKTHRKHWGNEKSKILVWEGSTKLMNPTLDQQIIDDAYDEDPVAARSEWGTDFREDIAIWLPREVIESVVKKGRMELLPRTLKYKYFAFADVSGGRVEDSALAIAHHVERKVIVDFIKLYKSPHDPIAAIRDMSQQLKKFGIRKCIGDNYSAEFIASSFRSCKIRYEKCSITASQLYIEVIPIIGSSAVELLDNETLVNQFASLLRFTRSGGMDKITHSQGSKDDLANAVAGVIYCTAKPKRKVGAFFTNTIEPEYSVYGDSEITKVSILAG